jgi:hypothetical protein
MALVLSLTTVSVAVAAEEKNSAESGKIATHLPSSDEGDERTWSWHSDREQQACEESMSDAGIFGTMLCYWTGHAERLVIISRF